MTNTRLQYAIGRDQAARDQFLKVSRQLGLWLERQSLKLTSERERDILGQLNSAYEDYLQRAGALSAGRNVAAPREDSLAAFTQVRAESQRLFDLGQELAEAH
jgi:hypothetical protein